jgi:hypothetical protein
MNNEKSQPKIILTDAEKKAKQIEYCRQWRLNNKDRIAKYRKDNAPVLAAFQRKYDHAKRNDPAYKARLQARQKRYRDKKAEEKRLLKETNKEVIPEPIHVTNVV